MSRTTRKTSYDRMSASARRQSLKDRYIGDGRNEKANPYIYGRDGALVGICDPFPKAPKGFDVYDRRRPRKSSRPIKRMSSRILRRRGRKFIKEEVFLMNARDDEEVYSPRSYKKNPWSDGFTTPKETPRTVPNWVYILNYHDDLLDSMGWFSGKD